MRSLGKPTRLLALLLLPTAMASVELTDAEILAGGGAALENGAGTIRIEGARVGALRPPVFVPEPTTLWQVGSGAGLLAFLARHRLALRRGPDREGGR